MVILGAIATPQVSPGLVVAGEDRTTAIADDVVRIDEDLEAGDYVWQSSEQEAFDDGALLPFRLGILVSIADPLNLITEAGDFSRLLPGQAVGVTDREQVNVQTLTGKPGPWVAIELVPAEDADDPTAPEFPLKAGQHEWSLQLFGPTAGDAIEIRQLIQPILILVQSAEFTPEPLVAPGTPDDDAASLGPGESASLLFDTRLRQSGDSPAAFFVATLDAPNSDSGDDASAAPSSSPRETTATSAVGRASPGSGASPRRVTVCPTATSACPSETGPISGRPSASSSAEPSQSGLHDSPQFNPSAKAWPHQQRTIRDQYGIRVMNRRFRSRSVGAGLAPPPQRGGAGGGVACLPAW